MVTMVITWIVFLIGFLLMYRWISKIEVELVTLALAASKDFEMIRHKIMDVEVWAGGRIAELEDRIKELEEILNELCLYYYFGY